MHVMPGKLLTCESKPPIADFRITKIHPCEPIHLNVKKGRNPRPNHAWLLRES